LAYAQQTAYAVKKVVELQNNTGSTDVLSGFVNCERENVTITFFDDAIHYLKYMHKQKHVLKNEFMRNEKGKFILDEYKNKIPVVRHIPEQWQGFCKDTGKLHYISDIEVKKMVTPRLLEQVKRQTLAKAQVWVEIPPGANNVHREFPSNVHKGPKIHYV
jgi:hypothetical protein